MGKLRQTQLWRRSVLWKMIISLEWVFVRDRIKMAEAGRDKLGGWLATLALSDSLWLSL